MTPKQKQALRALLKDAKARLFDDDLAAGHFGKYPPDYKKRQREVKEIEKLLTKIRSS